MEPYHLPRSTWQLRTSNYDYLQETIPWWQDVNASVEAELCLDSRGEVRDGEVAVVVIGGGVAGLSAALSARLAGAEVVLLEAAHCLGAGATGRNAGILSAGVNMGVADLDPEGAVASFWPRTSRTLLRLVEEAKYPESLLQAHLTGALSLAENVEEARMLGREVRARLALGVRAELWSAEEVALATGGRMDVTRVVRAMWLPDEGRIQPLTLLAHLARQARAMGVQMFGRSQVASYQEFSTATGRTAWLLTMTDGTTMNAGGVINAVGPTSRPTARIFALSFGIDLPIDFPLFWDSSPYTYADYRPGYGRLTVSGGSYGSVGDGKHTREHYRSLINSARHWLPELADQEPAYTWGVDLNVTDDMVPGIRNLGMTAPGLAIEGLGALGVLPGIVLGEQAGEQLVSQLTHSRRLAS